MSSPIALQEFLKAGFEDFIVPNYESAPFTTIQNRALVTRSMKAIAGVERVVVNSIDLLQNEFGPNGERVWEAGSKDSRIRYVGSWASFSGSNGSVYGTIVTNDFLEVTFYGTGLNGLMGQDISTRDWRVSVDGGSEGANIIVANLSGIIHARNYAANAIVPLASGLSLGWHTVKVRNANVNGLFVLGFEILNQRTDLAVYSGAGISNGSSQGLSALTTSAFNAGVSGTRGARIVKYVQGGVVSQAVQEVDATSKYLTLADHTNEEVVRRINWREFGANRADDFSTLTSSFSSRAFTLNDGTTTLTCVNGYLTAITGSILIGSTAGNSATFTFVGSGVDLIVDYDSGAITTNTSIHVDGVLIGTIPPADLLKSKSVIKIASGLPYGTHTLRITRDALTTHLDLSDFIIYQPKKPSIPAGALEVAAYNVMADYVANAVAGVETIAAGVLRKNISVREATYIGTWAFDTFVPGSVTGGFQVTTSTNGSSIEYTFYGTGFEYRSQAALSYSTNVQVSLNGTNATTANFPTMVNSVYGGFSFTAATGVLSFAAAANLGAGFRLSGLPLGKYTVKFQNNAALKIEVEAFDIITPIHSQEASLKVGSQSIHSVTKYSPEKSISNAGPDLSKAKAWVSFSGTLNTIYKSGNVSAILITGTGTLTVYFEKPFKDINYQIAYTGNAAQCYLPASLASKKTNYVELTTTNTAGAATTATVASLVFFGELIGEGEN